MADYFTRFTPNPAEAVTVHRLFLEQLRLMAAAATRNPLAARQARLLGAAYEQFTADLVITAERTAELANTLIPAHYQATRVRPPTGNQPHLADALPTSEPIVTALPAGIVGIVRLDKLDEFPYWKAQEYGSDHLVGREIRGWFFSTGFGRASLPNPAEFREHPLFVPSSTTGRTMKVQNPIEEGKFIRSGVDAAHAFWLKEMRDIANEAVKDIRAVRGLSRRAGLGPARATREERYKRLRRAGARGPKNFLNVLGRYA